MVRIVLQCAVLAALCGLGSTVQAQVPLALEGLAHDADLADRVAILRDPAGTLTLAQVRRMDGKFEAHDGSPLSFGLDRTPAWFRFSVRNASARPIVWRLEVSEPTLELVELFVVHADGPVEAYRSGTSLPFENRAIRHANFVFELASPAHEDAVVYVRAFGPLLRAPLRAWVPEAYVAHHESDLLLRTLSLGALLLVALYHFGIFWLVRQVENAWYALVALSLAGVLMSLNGQLAQFLLPHHPQLVMRSPPLTIALAMVAVSFFTYAATLELGTQSTLSRVLFTVALSTLGLLLMAALAPVSVSLHVLLTTLMAVTLSGPFMLRAVRRYHIPEMQLYSIGWYTLIMSIPVAILRYVGLLPDGVVSEWILPVGFVAYGVANSLALAALAGRLRRELHAINGQLVDNVQELKNALVRAEQANEQAWRATKAKDEFVATMSHELRTPLNAIINIPQGLINEFATVRSVKCGHCQAVFLLDEAEQVFADTACDNCQQAGQLVEGTKVKFRGDEARCLRFLQKIERSGQHLLQMVNGVLDYSKLEAGRFELVLGPVDVDALIREVGDQLVDLAQRKSVQLDLIGAPSREGPLQADGLRLKQVLINLLANAIKFSEPGTSVTMRWTSTRDAELIEVEDRGIGIAPADHERVFTSFEQVHKGDTRKYGGTGLGLSISRSLVRMHGGELSVRSELGHGATFIVRLPRMRPGGRSPADDSTQVRYEHPGAATAPLARTDRN